MKHPSAPFRLLSLLLISAALTACDNRNIHQVVKEMAEAPVDTTGFTTQTVQTNAFSAVEVDCFADVTFHQSPADSMSVRLSANKDVLAHTSVRVIEEKLYIATDRRYRMPESAVIAIDIYAPFVSSLMLNGGKCLRLGTLRLSCPLSLEINGVGALCADTIAASEVSLTLNGSGSIDLKGLDTERLTGTINGSGRVLLAGRAATSDVAINGAGSVDTSALHH